MLHNKVFFTFSQICNQPVGHTAYIYIFILNNINCCILDHFPKYPCLPSRDHKNKFINLKNKKNNKKSTLYINLLYPSLCGYLQYNIYSSQNVQ